MRHLILIFAILIGTLLNAQDDNIYDISHIAVKDRAQHFKVDADILQAVIVAYMEPDSVGYQLITEKGMTQRGSVWEIVHRTAKYMAIQMKTKRNCTNNIACWKHTFFSFIDIIPEHPGIDVTTELHDTGKGYFKEVKVQPEPEIIINIEDPISLTCDKDDTSSLCQWMKEQSAKASVDQMRTENLEWQQSLNDLEYDWKRLVIEIGDIISSPLQDIDQYDPNTMVEALYRQMGQLESQTIKVMEKRNQFN